ncbi:MAG: HlyD family efflux transporter periplasmic adaptor subunit [Sphingobacterium sp.]
MEKSSSFGKSQSVQNKDAQTEEITEIVERVPTSFSSYVLVIVSGIIICLLLFGFLIKYPDVVLGEISITGDVSPIDLVANTSGKIRLKDMKSLDQVNADEMIAWIENGTAPEIISQIDESLLNFEFPLEFARGTYDSLAKDLNLGELSKPYSEFLVALKHLADFQDHKSFENQAMTFEKIFDIQQDALRNSKEKEILSQENLILSQTVLKRDSALFLRSILSQEELDQSKSKVNLSENEYKSAKASSSSILEQMSNTQNTINDYNTSGVERKQSLELEALLAYNALLDHIHEWEQKYLIKSPIVGKVQFLKFWREGQFVNSGESLFSIVPAENNTVGQVILPIDGAGKIQVGQEVIVKLADFPYLEYGFIRGRVQSIPLISSKSSLRGGQSLDSYLVTVEFPMGMVTNYGSKIDFKFDIKGTAEIITNERKLIERFFDNLKYMSQ